MRALVIGGVDYTRKIVQGSLKISLVDFDGENAQTTLDLVNHRDFLGRLYKIQVTLTRLTGEEMQRFMTDTGNPDGFPVTFISLETNAEITLTFQNTSRQTQVQRLEGDKVIYESISFSLNQTM